VTGDSPRPGAYDPEVTNTTSESTSPTGPAGSGDLRAAWRAESALLIGFLMILIDSTIVSVATPAIMTGLRAGVAEVIWVSSAYLLAYAVPLLITGRMGDRWGPKRLYLIGMTVFTGASLWCGLAGSIGMLIIARAVQGLGAAMLSPQTMTLITRLFPAQKRGAAMGAWGATAGVATLVGPILGGVLTSTVGWEWIFFVNVPIGVIALVMAWRLVPDLPTHPHRFDWPGVVLSGVAMFLIVFGLQEGESLGWGPQVWSMIVVGAIVMGLFVWWQARTSREPLVPVRLFADRNFGAAGVGVTLMGMLVTAMPFPMMLWLQDGRGLSASAAALLTVPSAVVSIVMGPLAGRWIDSHDPRPVAVAGFGLLALSMVANVIIMGSDTSPLWLLVTSTTMGLASSGIWSPLSVSATRNLPADLAGAGSGVYNAARQLGAVIGSAAIAALIANRLGVLLPGVETSGVRLDEAAQRAYGLAMGEATLLVAICALVGIVVASLLKPHRGGSAN